MALISLALLLVAVVLGFVRKMNTGLVCIAFALILGRLAGVSDKDIIAGFSYNLFIMLLGVTYLFSLAQNNGCLNLVAKKVVALAGRRTYLVPVLIYVFSVVLAAIGPGCIPTMAIMMVFSMALAHEMQLRPEMLSALSVLGASGGGVSPLAPTGIIATNLCADAGMQGVEMPFLINGVLATTVYAAVVYIALGGYRLHSEKVLRLEDIPAFNRKQKITLAGIMVMVVMVMGLHINVGLMSFLIGAVLSFLGVADEGEAIKKIPWGTLLLVGGVSVLMNLIIKLGGIHMLSEMMASVMTPATAPAIVGASAGLLSWFSSTSGVVMPTFIPTLPELVESMGGAVNPLELATGLTMIAHTAGISPLSTGGGLALAAYTSAAGSSHEEQQHLFVRMFAISAGGILFLSFMAYLGLFKLFI